MSARPAAILLLLLLGSAATPAGAASLQQSPDCRFVLGFAALRAQIPAVVGACLEDERHNPENGDTLQRTTGGLLVWRKADNWTAFTDGHRTWINGPNGLQRRLNSERFDWEAGGGAGAPAQAPARLTWPAGPLTADEAGALARAEVARWLGVPPERLVVARAEAVEWSDASLGCAQPGSAYAQVIVPGHRVLLTLDGRALHVHAAAGRALLCPSPTG
jgi:hypothetical protein